MYSTLRPESPAPRSSVSSASSSCCAVGILPPKMARTRSKIVAAAFTESCWPTIARNSVP